MSRYSLQLLGFMALACAVAACGGDDDGGQPRTATTTAPPTATRAPTETETPAPTATAAIVATDTARPSPTATLPATATATVPPSATPTPTDTPSPTPTEPRGASVAVPTIEGPISGGHGAPFVVSTTFDLAEVGYEQAEYFISGTATAYTSADPLGEDGMWTTVSPGDTAAYKTRILVYRPVDPAKFNGTVIVEWLNVSNCIDLAGAWINAHTELIRSGSAWVGVSAQTAGVDGTGPATVVCLNPNPFPLKTFDPERYGALVHPGDSFSYDIFSQAAQAIRRPAGVDPLGGLRVEALIAAGQSQSAHRLVTYIDAVHPLADIYDAYLVHGRGGTDVVEGTLRLSEPPQPEIVVQGTSRIRSDLDVPVLNLQPETMLAQPLLYSVPARQPDSERFRLWEVPGTADADAYLLVVGAGDLGDSPSAANLLVTSTVLLPDGTVLFTCDSPINSGPQHFVVNAAIAALDRWVRQGTPPASAPRIELDGDQLHRDANGNALGGVRTPQLDVPIATLSGATPSGGSFFCFGFGTTVPFDEATLQALYPDHETYVTQFNEATDRAVDAGFILPPDADLMKTAAAQSDIGS